MERTLAPIELAGEPLAEARFPVPVVSWWDVGRGTPFLDQFADLVGVIGFVIQHDDSRARMIEHIPHNMSEGVLSQKLKMPGADSDQKKPSLICRGPAATVRTYTR